MVHLFSEFPFTVVFLINQNASSVLPCRKELGRTFASFGLGLGQRTGWITPAGRVVAESLPDLSALGPVCSRIPACRQQVPTWGQPGGVPWGCVWEGEQTEAWGVRQSGAALCRWQWQSGLASLGACRC